jgi:hypothetical protein
MLEKLIHEIQAGGTLEANALAARLDTSPQMVKVMLGHLERMGKLQDLAQCTDGGCGQCGMAGSCSIEQGKGARIWQIVK